MQPFRNWIKVYKTLLQAHNSTCYANNIDDGSEALDNITKMVFKGNSTVYFTNNKAIQVGGAIFHQSFGIVAFEDYSTIKFEGNSAKNSGTIVSATDYVSILFTGRSDVTFINNRAVSGDGGAIVYLQFSHHFLSIKFEMPML